MVPLLALASGTWSPEARNVSIVRELRSSHNPQTPDEGCYQLQRSAVDEDAFCTLCIAITTKPSLKTPRLGPQTSW
jgi:hypothetical protein